jgi:hypothetical protein
VFRFKDGVDGVGVNVSGCGRRVATNLQEASAWRT